MSKSTFAHVRQALLAALLLIPLLIACSQTPEPPQVTQATVAPTVAPTEPPTVGPTAAPTDIPPTATPEVFRFAEDVEIAGVDVGGLTEEEATQQVADALDAYDHSMSLQAPGYSKTINAADFLEMPAADELVANARELAEADEPATEPLKPTVDEAALRTFVEGLAPDVELPTATDIISDAKALTQTFTFAASPGRTLDVDGTVEAISQALDDPDTAEEIELVFDEATVARPPISELERVLIDHAAFWKGVAAFYVHDLVTGETVAYNADTVFSGASVMKVPIMIFAYSRLGELNEQQRGWMHKMIIDSENLEANDLLAAAVGGQGTEAALDGVNEMTKMLEDLGLEHTYQLIPYESGEWLIQQSMLPAGGPAKEGEAPYTTPDGYLRTTPREMGTLFVMLSECTEGKGPLIEKFSETLNADLCQEMVDWLQQPHDEERMVAGLPPGTLVAHKGGWIDDMQSDVGIVDSPGGRYVAAIYIWREGYVTDVYASPSPYLGDFSHTIYTYFNPEPLSTLDSPDTEADSGATATPEADDADTTPEPTSAETATAVPEGEETETPEATSDTTATAASDEETATPEQSDE